MYGEGLLKTVFKAVKAAAGGLGLERVFITGVSPIVMSDMTSGYNVAYIARLPQGEDLLVAALSGDDQVVIPELARRFGVEDMLRAVKDQPFMASLLYYFGVLTLADLGVLRKLALKVPNLVARALYVERLRDLWLPGYEERETVQRVAETLYLRGDLAPLCDFIETRYFRVLSNRDYRWTNELLVKFAFLTLLFDDRIYMAVSELETDRGYADLALIVRPDMRRYAALDLLLEFKYLGLKELGLTGEQVRAQSRESLAALPAVAAKLDEAAEQARVYGAALRRRHGLTDLRACAVVALGVERLVWRALTEPGRPAPAP